MLGIFTGAGTGFERGSGSVLGGAGLLGSGSLGRSGEQLLFNAATGNLLISRQDEYLVGQGPDVGISRTYNSLGNLSDDNGDNWRQSTDRRVYGLTGTLNTAGSTVKRVSGDGSEITYSWDVAKAAYVATDGAGAYDKLTSAADVWTWTDGDSQITEKYANTTYGYWRLTEQSDTDGNKLTFTYTGAQLTRVTTAGSGAQVGTIDYVWSGWNITQIVTGYTDLATGTAETLTRTRYAYDGYSRLTGVTVDLSPDDNAVADGKVYQTNYTYHGATKQIATITQTDGSQLAIAYDASGRVTTMTQTAAAGVTRVTSIVYGAGYTSVTDPVGQVTRLDYNADGSLKKVTAPPAVIGAAAQVVQFAYNATGDLTGVTDALGQVSSFVHDAWGNVSSQTDRLGNIVTRTYGTKNQLLTETRTGSNAAAAAAQHTTRYVYDAENHLRYVISAEGKVAEYRYTAAGGLQYTIDYPEHAYDVSGLAAGVAPTEAQVDAWRNALADRSSTRIGLNTIDARGNISASLSYGFATTSGAASTAEGYSRTYYVYDQAGQLLSRNAQGEVVETFVYDGMGRLTASTDLNGGTTSIVFQDVLMKTVVTLANGYVTTSTYNKAGDLVSTIDSGSHVAGGTTSYLYDKLGRARVATGPTGNKSYVVYDKAGRLVGDINHLGELTEYRYDANNRLVATARYNTVVSAANLTALGNPDNTLELSAIRPVAHAYDLWIWQVYDKEGRVIEAIDGDGGVTAYAYDASGRLIATTGYANKLTAAQLSAFKATAPGVVTLPTANAAKDSIARSFYDKDGRLLGVLDGEGYLSRLVYDQAGQKVQEIAFATATTAALRATGTFNQLLASVGTSANDRSTRFVYDGQGLLRYQLNGLDQVTGYIHNTAGKVTQATVYAGSIAAAGDYTYDNVKALITSSGLAANAANRTSFMVYDAAGRVAYATDAEQAVTGFSYDNMGQVTRTVAYAVKRTTGPQTISALDSWTAGQALNASNRVTRNYYTARGELKFTVDAEGYVTRSDFNAAGQTTRTVRWDTKIAATDASTIDTVNAAVSGAFTDASFTYDQAGRVTLGYDGAGVATQHVYLANGLLSHRTEAYGTTDAVTTRYTYDGAGQTIKVEYADGTGEEAAVQYAYNGLGDLVSTTDANGNITAFSYDKAGRMLSQTNALAGVVAHEYNAFGDAVKTTDARGNASYSYYDKIGRVITTRDAESHVTETGYTVFGEVSGVVRRYNKATNTASTAVLPVLTGHALDAATMFQYDKLGRVVRTTDAEGAYEQYTLDAFGQRVTVRNKLGGTITNAYDRRGLLVQETLPMASIDRFGATVAAQVTNRFEYDARGNRTKMIEAYSLAEARTTTYLYDKVNRLTETRGDAVQVVSQVNHSVYSSATPVERIIYDKRGNVIETIDANGARTLFYYDKLNRKIADISAAKTLSSYTYDDNGNVLTSRTYGTPLATVPATAGGTPPAAPAGEYRETVYTYDALNRLKTTSMAGIRNGYWNGSAYVTNVGSVLNLFDYDANGNLVKSTDGNGSTIFSYYDKLGRKTAQVDQNKYLTSWTHDAEGNVISERRYATVATATIVTTAPPVVATNGADRVTSFTYDRNGRRLTETRSGVAAKTVNIYTGGLVTAGTNATVTYQYNALGQVSAKIEATGDRTDYVYDATGRLVTETRAGFKDYTNPDDPYRPTVRYYYNGLNDLTFTRQGAEEMAGTDRFTRYAYGAGGRLDTMTDANGAVFSYSYDAAGNILRENYNRQKSDGTSTLEGILYTRDALGRTTAQVIAAWNGSAWLKGDSQNTAYNAYGETAQRGVNGMWQESFTYDKAGRVVATNTGDGVWRYFIYDAAGRQTAAIENEGSIDLVAKTVDQAIAFATNNGANAIGAVYKDGVNATISVNDGRGQTWQTLQLKRQLSEASAPVDLTSGRTYNAFGEVIAEYDTKGNGTHYTYNTMGRVLSIQRPAVSITLENGTKQTVSPLEYFFYDISGRTIGVQDANGNIVTRLLLAGTGYGQSEALVSWEWHADGGRIINGYDVFGDLRRTFDEVDRRTDMTYDAMGRLTQMTRAAGLTLAISDNYTYDALGQRLTHWNSFLGSSVVEKTDYDVQGRLVRHVAFGGDTTTTSYVWNGALATAGFDQVFGGWRETTTYANGKAQIVDSDMFGRNVWKRDLGNHDTSFAYDRAGRLVSRVTGGDTLNYNYLNINLVGSLTSGYGSAASASANQGESYELNRTVYRYDAAGNKTSEVYTREGGSWQDYGYYDPWDYSWYPNYVYEAYSYTYQNATASYDALGRMTNWVETGNGATPASRIDYEYDANGNVRRTRAEYRWLNQAGVASSTVTVQDLWYRFDAMNRVVTSKGSLVGGQIVRGYAGVDITYDKAGQRITARRTKTEYATVQNPYYDPYGGGGGPYPYQSASVQRPIQLGGGETAMLPPGGGGDPYIDVAYEADSIEQYGYDERGALATVRVATSGYYDNYDGTVTVTPPPITGSLKANYYYDGMGRMTRQVDWLGNGANAAYDRTMTLNAAGQVTYEVTITKQGSNTNTTYTSNVFGSGAAYALGSVISSSTSIYKNGAYQNASSTTNTYAWYDGAVQASVTHKPNTSQTTTYTTSYYYNAAGQLTSAYISDGRPRSVSYTNDMLGQVIRRDEADNNYNATTGGDPHEVWYRFNGKQLGYTGNNGTQNTDYQGSINNRTATPGTGAFRNGATYGGANADFDQNYQAINSYNQGGNGGAYTVNAGDTLGSIALQLWGDASLWYKLAEANGMSASNALVEGQRLTIPAGVMKSTHNASTLKPYDPAEAMGDTSPTTPKPQTAQAAKKNKCGVFGQILLVVIAVAVSALTYGALTGPATTALGAIGAGAVSGAAGSIASQAFGVATGIQDKFSWKGVALAALGGAVGAGMGPKGLFGAKGAFGGVKSSFLQGALRGAAGSLATQGIAVATGLQDKFDWTGVAAAGLGGGAASWATARLGDSVGQYTRQALSSSAGAITNAAARSLMEGSDFGDNLLTALPDVIGQTLGNMIADPIVGRMQDAKVERLRTAPGGETMGAAMAAPGVGNGAAAEPTAGAGGGMVGEVNTEAASAASAAILRVPSVGSAGGDAAATGFGYGDLQYSYGDDPVTKWLASEWLRDDFPGALDAYATSNGMTPDAVAGLLWSEANSAYAGQLTNQFTLLGNSSGRGSQTAALIAEGLYSRSNQGAINSVIGTSAYDPLIGAFNSSFMLAAPRYSISNSGPPIYSYLTAAPTLTGWQRGSAFIDGVGHGVITGLLGFATVVTAPACATVVGCVLPVGLGLGTAFEADNAYTNLKMAFTGSPQNTLGAQVISNTFDISPRNAELAYVGVQVLTGVGAARGASNFVVKTSQGFAVQSFAPEAMVLRQSVVEGAPLYRTGNMSRSELLQPQFWAMESPLTTANYAARYGIPPANVAVENYLSIGTLQQGAKFIIRPAPGAGGNAGGALEVVTGRGGASLRYFGPR